MVWWRGSGANYTIYIFRNNTEYVNRDFHFIVGGVVLYRPLYIHLFIFPSVCGFFSHSGTFICTDVGIAFQYHSKFNWQRPACREKGCSWVMWRELKDCHCDRSQLRCLNYFVMFGWFNFAENICVLFVCLNGGWGAHYRSYSFDWCIDWFLTSRIPFYIISLHIFFFYITAVTFSPWLEFALIFFLFHLTCGTNANLQDRRLWVCMLNIFSKV